MFGGVGAGLYGMLVMVRAHRVHRGPDGRAARPSTSARRSRRARCRWRCSTCSSSRASSWRCTAVCAVLPAGLAGLNNAGPHGLSEILYAFTSAAGNNGSAFAGLTGTTYFYNTMLGAGDAHRPLRDDRADARPRRLPRRRRRRAGERRARSPSPARCSSLLLIGVILIVGALTFFPALALGPDRRAPLDAGREGCST